MNQILDSIRIALQSIWANKLRSLLTVLGNIVAVTSIVTVVSLIQGMNAYGVQRDRQRRRRRLVHVQRMPPIRTRGGRGARRAPTRASRWRKRGRSSASATTSRR